MIRVTVVVFDVTMKLIDVSIPILLGTVTPSSTRKRIPMSAGRRSKTIRPVLLRHYRSCLAVIFNCSFYFYVCLQFNCFLVFQSLTSLLIDIAFFSLL